MLSPSPQPTLPSISKCGPSVRPAQKYPAEPRMRTVIGDGQPDADVVPRIRVDDLDVLARLAVAADEVVRLADADGS